MKQTLQQLTNNPIPSRFISVISILFFLQTTTLFSDTDITGIVTAKRDNLLKVEFQPNETAVPKSGDKVDFYLEMEGMKVEVGTGSVTKVDGKNVWVHTSDDGPDLKMNAVIFATGLGEIENVDANNNTLPLHLCDELVGDPWDNQRIGPAVKISSIDTDKTIKACTDALKEHATTPRFIFQLARAYRVDLQYDKAFYYYKLAADLDYVAAQFGVGWAYNEGKGTKSNYSKAAEWFRKAAEQGHAKAQYELGICYEYGDKFGLGGLKQDREKAKEWFLKAAEQGYVPAQGMMGFMYLDGGGVAQDNEKARMWFLKAAEQGHILSQQDLGMMYSTGKGAQPNYGEAAKWYRKLALQCDGDAQYSLGELYINGKGVPKNKYEAIYWFYKAASQGHEEAKKELDVLGINADLERLLQ